MDYCGPRGISHSHFLGGPPRWTPLDRDKALAWAQFDGERCPSCRTRAAEWDPAQGGRDDAYTAELRKCWGCDCTAVALKQVREEMGAGVYPALLPTPRPRRR